MNPEPEIVNERGLFLDGFVYVRLKPSGNKTHWDCYLLRKGQCKARATTVTTGPRTFIVTKGPVAVEDRVLSEHTHPPNRKYAEAEKMKLNMKRKAAEHPEERPTTVSYTHLTLPTIYSV